MTQEVRSIIVQSSKTIYGESVHYVAQSQMIIVIQEYIKEVKGISVAINIHKVVAGVPSFMHSAILSNEIEKLSSFYDYAHAYFKKQLDDEKNSTKSR